MNPEIRKEDLKTFKQVSNSVDNMRKKESTLLIGIDGCGGFGKSYLADKLRNEYSNVTIIHMDDFHFPSSKLINANPRNKPIGADFDWRRVLKDVLNPVSQESTGYYQRYDWDKDDLAEWHTVPVGDIVIVEGVYAIRKELANKYDIRIWVDTPREVRLSRGIKRDGEEARGMWENNWMVSEDLYVERQMPFKKADFIVRGIS